MPPFPYTKFNLTNDRASYECWEAQIRAWQAVDESLLQSAEDKARARVVQPDICIIAVRRKFIPPLMTSAQDIVVRFYGRRMRSFESALRGAEA